MRIETHCFGKSVGQSGDDINDNNDSVKIKREEAASWQERASKRASELVSGGPEYRCDLVVYGRSYLAAAAAPGVAGKRVHYIIQESAIAHTGLR